MAAPNIFALDPFWAWYFQTPDYHPAIQHPWHQQENTITVWITNYNGSQTEVKIIPTVDGFVGPKGEFYSSMPTAEQLRPLYGLYSPPPVKNNCIVYLGKVNGVEKVVVLTKNGTQFIGPKGETYPNFPSIDQLRLIYCNTSTLISSAE